MRIKILESSGLAKHEELIVDNSILNSVQFFSVIYNWPTLMFYLHTNVVLKTLDMSILIKKREDLRAV